MVELGRGAFYPGPNLCLATHRLKRSSKGTVGRKSACKSHAFSNRKVLGLGIF